MQIFKPAKLFEKIFYFFLDAGSWPIRKHACFL